MLRREFLGAAALLWAQQKKEESATASATYDSTPQVGIVLSSFTGGEDHDGTKVEGLREPKPVDADLSDAQVDGMVRKAIELARVRRGGLLSIVEAEDWVVLKIDPRGDARVVKSVVDLLAGNKRGLRFTIAGQAAPGAEYKRVVEELSQRHSGLEFDVLDLSAEEWPELPLPGKPDRKYKIPKAIQRCDRLISIAPLKTDPDLGVALAVRNAVAGATAETLSDLYSYHPADFAVLGGGWGMEDGGGAVRHNIAIAGASALAVDTIGAAVMGFDPAKVPYLAALAKRGFGVAELELIWTRGNEVEQARRQFRKPARWG